MAQGINAAANIDLPTLSYATNTTTGITGGTWGTTTDFYPSQVPLPYAAQGSIQGLEGVFAQLIGTAPHQTLTEIKEKIVARLIRYTVVDPDPTIAKERPEFAILMEGTVMLDGTDDKGFLMDLAPKVADRLSDHNTRRTGITYEDSEGKTKNLKAVKLSQLDVVIESLREYKK